MPDTKALEELAATIFAGFVRDYFGDGVIWGSEDGDYEPPDYVRMREAAWDAAEAFYGV